MYRKRRTPWAVYLLPVFVGLTLWWTNVWPFRRGGNIPARIPTVADGATHAYDSLSAEVRSKVAADDFAAMFQRMVDPEGGAPTIQRAIVSDAMGPERARARFRVEYPASKANAEFHFERLDDAWQLQFFTRVTSHDRPLAAAGQQNPDSAAATESGTSGDKRLAPAPLHPAPDGTKPRTADAPPPGADARRSHVVQAGDTLSAISTKYYGSTQHWRLILEANPGLDAKRLRIGRKILIPALPEQTPRPAEAPNTGA